MRAFRNERQESWLEGLESTFRHFGGVTSEVPFDKDRGLVSRHEVATREGHVARRDNESLQGRDRDPFSPASAHPATERRRSNARCKLKIPAKRIRELHLAWRSARGLKHSRGGDQHAQAPRPGCRDVQAV